MSVLLLLEGRSRSRAEIGSSRLRWPFVVVDMVWRNGLGDLARGRAYLEERFGVFTESSLANVIVLSDLGPPECNLEVLLKDESKNASPELPPLMSVMWAAVGCALGLVFEKPEDPEAITEVLYLE
jgi:hypothetical protein